MFKFDGLPAQLILLAASGLVVFSVAREQFGRARGEIRPLLPRVDCSSLRDGYTCAMELADAIGAILGAADTCDDLASRLPRLRARGKELVTSVATDQDDLEWSLERLENGDTLWRERHNAGSEMISHERYSSGLETEDCSQIRDGIAVVEKRLWLK